MKFFKHPYLLRRYGKPDIIQGYASLPYQDHLFLLDIQTLKNEVSITEDGAKSVQQIKVFCESEILTENKTRQQKADRIWFQDKWFECRSSRLSENTPLRHWTAVFVECLDVEPAPNLDGGGSEESEDESGSSEGSLV